MSIQNEFDCFCVSLKAQSIFSSQVTDQSSWRTVTGEEEFHWTSLSTGNVEELVFFYKGQSGSQHVYKKIMSDFKGYSNNAEKLEHRDILTLSPLHGTTYQHVMCF